MYLADVFYFDFSALVQSMERSKRKYQSRIRKMEQQMLGMVERHSAQVSILLN